MIEYTKERHGQANQCTTFSQTEVDNNLSLLANEAAT